VAAVSEPITAPGGPKPSDIAHVAHPGSDPLTALCGRRLRGLQPPPGTGECVVCTELWNLKRTGTLRWGGYPGSP
jgi:hypothetical protein